MEGAGVVARLPVATPRSSGAAAETTSMASPFPKDTRWVILLLILSSLWFVTATNPLPIESYT